MCIVSMIGDDWRKRLSDDYPWVGPYIKPAERITWPPQRVSSEEIEKLRKEIESLKKLLKAAKIYDEETDQPDHGQSALRAGEGEWRA